MLQVYRQQQSTLRMQIVKALQGRNLDLCLLRVFAPFCRVAFLPNTNHFEPQVGSQPRQIQFSVKLISEHVCCFSSFKSLWQFSVVSGHRAKRIKKCKLDWQLAELKVERFKCTGSRSTVWRVARGPNLGTEASAGRHSAVHWAA